MGKNLRQSERRHKVIKMFHDTQSSTHISLVAPPPHRHTDTRSYPAQCATLHPSSPFKCICAQNKHHGVVSLSSLFCFFFLFAVFSDSCHACRLFLPRFVLGDLTRRHLRLKCVFKWVASIASQLSLLLRAYIGRSPF